MSTPREALADRLKENPFAAIEADYYTDPENLVQHFSVNVLRLIPDFFVQPNVLLCGGQGTGKTMLFRYLDYATQFSLNASSWSSAPTELLSQCRACLGGDSLEVPLFVGVYLKLNDIPSALLAACSDESTAQRLFLSYLDGILVTRLLMALRKIDSTRAPSAAQADWQSTLNALNASGPWGKAEEVSSAIEEQAAAKREIDMWLQQLRPSVDESPKRLLSGTAHVRMAEALCGKGGALSGAKIVVMLDEYERLPDAFKECVNTLTRERPPYVHYKIGSRRYGLRTVATLDEGDHVQDGTDLLIIDLESTYTDSAPAYREFLTDIALKRLKSAGSRWAQHESSIEDLFIPTTPEEAARRILEKAVSPDTHRENFARFLTQHDATDQVNAEQLYWDKNPVAEKLNMLLAKRRVLGRSRITFSDEKIREMCEAYDREPKVRSRYRTAYDKNRLSLVLQLAREYRVPPRIYAGFSVLARLSGGAPRTFLALLFESLERAKASDTWETMQRVSVDAQCAAAEKKARDFLHDVRRVPQFGTDLYRFAMNMGAFLRALHLDELVRNAEPTYIGISETPDDPYLEVLVAAHMYSVLLSKDPVKPAIGKPLPDDHVMQPLLAPMFQLSYHRRGRTPLTTDELAQLMVGDENIVGALAKRMLSRSAPSGTSANQMAFELEEYDDDDEGGEDDLDD